MAGVGGARRERADGDVGRDWAGEAADFRAARAARWRTDKAGRSAQRTGNRRTQSCAIRRKSGGDRETEERTPGRDSASSRWGAQRPRPPASTHGVNERRDFEGCAGAWRWRHRERSPQLFVTRIRDDGQAEPSRYCAAAPPPCRPARKPRSALAPAALSAERAVRAVGVTG